MRLWSQATSLGLVERLPLIDALIERKPHPQQVFRAAAGIIRLAERYGNDRVETACRRAYATHAISYSCG